MDLEEFRTGLDAWLDQHAAELAPDGEPPADADTDAAEAADESAAPDLLAAEIAQINKVKRLAWDAGWMRYGWPESVGGLGGSTLLRGYLGEALAMRDLVKPGFWTMHEMMAPVVIAMAPELAAEVVPPLLQGKELWCQGFSEPSTGSNLGSLICRAVRTDSGWRVTGQKVWTSLAHLSQRCFLLTRTGTTESAHRGITAMLVDTDTAGMTIRPFHTMHGVEEFSEVFFDDALVPFSRTLGEEGQGWKAAMDLLPFERSSAMWLRNAYLYTRLQSLLDSAPGDTLSATALGDVLAQVFAFRAQSRITQYRLAAGEHLGPETSVDKILLSTTEQAVFDLAAESMPNSLLFDDEPDSEKLRSEFLYSRAATIYGGSLEIQRNIVAKRLLDLGSE